MRQNEGIIYTVCVNMVLCQMQGVIYTRRFLRFLIFLSGSQFTKFQSYYDAHGTEIMISIGDVSGNNSDLAKIHPYACGP
jgi:hypothetical protein